MRLTTIYKTWSKAWVISILVLITGFDGYTQLNESEIKAAYLLNFLDNLSFDDRDETNDTLKILVLDHAEVYEATTKLCLGKQVDGHEILVTDVATSLPHLVYTSSKTNSKLKNIGLSYQKSAIIGDVQHYLVDIQFIKNENQSIGFTISDKQLKKKHITPSSELLVYNDDKTEVLSLIDEQQVKLESLKQQSKDLTVDLEKMELEVEELNLKITQKEERLVELNLANKNKNSQLGDMQSQIAAKEKELNEINDNFLLSQGELNQLKEQLVKTYDAIGGIADSVSILQLSLNDKKALVAENEALLLDQQSTLSSQEKELKDSDRKANRNFNFLMALGVFAVVLSLFLYFLYRENRAKKRALVVVEQQNKSIQEASSQKDEFISNLSHEVRSPLNAIIGYADLIGNAIRNPETKKNIEFITMSSQNLLGMINDILDYRKIDAGKGHLDHTHFELKSIVQVVHNTLKVTAESKGLDYVLNYDDQLPKYIYSDPTKLSQILLNLLSNAIKFTAKGKVELSLNLVSKSTDTCSVEFKIIDSGIGIDKAKQELIFESFTQASVNTSKEFGGSGLGLSISQKLIELFGSKIEVSSQPGKGAAFSFKLDLELGQPVTSISKSTEEVLIEGFHDLRVLVVDDLKINRQLLTKQFESKGYPNTVTAVENGQQALEMVAKANFDLILTDIRMPGIDGVELTRKLRSSGYHNPIFGISANNLMDEREKCLDAGMNDYIVKPYSFNDLLMKMANSLKLNYDISIEKLDHQSNEFSFDRLYEITESKKDFEKIKQELLQEVHQNAIELKKDKSINLAHENVNKAAYFGNEEFLNLCRKLELEIRDGAVKEADILLNSILKILEQNI